MMPQRIPDLQILLIGKNGQLGWELNRTLACLGKIVAWEWPANDLSKPEALRQSIRQLRPAIIINAAAYTAVDRAEQEPALAGAINTTAPQVLAEEASLLGACLIHYSTDYVYDGNKSSPYLETDSARPINVYGKTKLQGDLAIQHSGCQHWIFRTSWVYSLRRDSFVTKVLQWSRNQKVLRIVEDQVGSPTWSRMLAEATALALAKGSQDLTGWFEKTSGVYHVAGDGNASRLDFARAILAADPRPEEQVCEELAPALTADFPTPACRPLYSALDCSLFKETFGIGLPAWEDSLHLLLETVK